MTRTCTIILHKEIELFGERKKTKKKRFIKNKSRFKSTIHFFIVRLIYKHTHTHIFLLFLNFRFFFFILFSF